MLCPNCNEPLLVLEYEHVEVDYCDDCRGVWLDPEELALLFEGEGAWQAALRPASGESLVKERSKHCPICRTVMHKREAGGTMPVITDLCPKGHGLWLDAGELHALIAPGEAGGVLGRLVAWLGAAFAAPAPPQ